jgi:hypothetical protein
MVTALKQMVTIQQGGRIEIPSSELLEGSNAEVIVLVEPVKRTVPLVGLIGKAQGSFSTVESVDSYLSGERDSWES